MEFFGYGVDFANKKGKFCERYETSVYFFSHFRNDYRVELNGELIYGKAGDMLINKPGDIIYHGAVSEDSEGFRNDWLYADGNDLAAILEKYPLPIGKPFHVNGLYLASAIEKIHKEKSFSYYGSQDKCVLIMADVIIDIYREYKREYVDKLEYARGEIMRDFKRDWLLSDIASLSGYSTSRFSALYKAKYGISPINDLISCRIENAKLLLKYGNMSVSEVAEAVGFSSIYYFSRQFKAKENVYPSEYKKRCRN